MFKLLKVSGDSLSPLYQEGDFVLIAKIPFLFSLREGDVVVFEHPAFGTMIKQVSGFSSDGENVIVLGTNAHSLDSRSFGPIPQRSIAGKVIWHIRKPVRQE